MCTDGTACKRRVCFFAHTDSELRKPEEDPVWLQQQLQAELAAGVPALLPAYACAHMCAVHYLCVCVVGEGSCWC